MINYTSGTTGFSKGVMLPYRALWGNLDYLMDTVKPKIGKNCIFAGQVGISGHLTIADKTTICAKTGVIGNVRKPGQTLFGIPALPHGTFLRAYAKFKQSGEE